jgi:hypothetical protein
MSSESDNTPEPVCVRGGITMTKSQWFSVPAELRKKYWLETDWGKRGPASPETVAAIRNSLALSGKRDALARISGADQKENDMSDNNNDNGGNETLPANTNGGGNGGGPALVNPYVAFGQREGSGSLFKGPQVKHDYQSGECMLKRGEEKTPIAADEPYKVNPHEALCGFNKHDRDNKIIDRVLGRIADGYVPPERAELGDLNKQHWPIANKDPWVAVTYLPLKSSTGEVCCYSATGESARAEVADLLGMYGATDRHGKVPVVALEDRSYLNRKYNRIVHVPVLRLITWEFWDEGVPMPPVQLVPIAPPSTPPARPAPKGLPPKSGKLSDDLSDDIPF